MEIVDHSVFWPERMLGLRKKFEHNDLAGRKPMSKVSFGVSSNPSQRPVLLTSARTTWFHEQIQK